MVHDLDVKNLLKGGFDLLDTRVAKLQDFPGVGEDDVVVLLDPVAFLVLRTLIAKLMTPYQVAVEQEVQSVV
jgi:hypothetical protein